jgi:hypothetical protein
MHTREREEEEDPQGGGEKKTREYLSFSLSLRNFSREALELDAQHVSDLPLQQERCKREIT